MARLDDFVGRTSPGAAWSPRRRSTRARARSPDEPEADAAVRLARLLIQQGHADHLPGPQGPRRGHPGLLPRRLPDPPAARRGGDGQGLPRRQRGGRRAGRHQGPAPRARPPRRARPCSGSAARWTSPGGSSTPTSPGPSTSASDGDVHFMVLEYVPGESLYQLVKQPRGGPLRVPDAARFFLKVVDGLEAAHDGGPGPPRHQAVEPDGHPRRRRPDPRPRPGPAPSDEESPLTRPNVVIGTLDYASPEQLGNAAAGRPPERPLQPGLHPLLRPRRPAPVRGGRRRQQDLQAADGRPRAAGAGRPGRPVGVRGDRPQADGQGPRRPLPGPAPSCGPTSPAGPTRRSSARSSAPRPRPPGPSGPPRPSSTTTTSGSSPTRTARLASAPRSATSAPPRPPPPRCTSRPAPPRPAVVLPPTRRPLADPGRRPRRGPLARPVHRRRPGPRASW